MAPPHVVSVSGSVRGLQVRAHLFHYWLSVPLAGTTCVEKTGIFFHADVFSSVPSVFAHVCIIYKSTEDCFFSLYAEWFCTISVRNRQTTNENTELPEMWQKGGPTVFSHCVVATAEPFLKKLFRCSNLHSQPTPSSFFLLTFLNALIPSQRGSSYGSLITAHGKYQLFAKTGYFKVRLSEFWHFQLLRTPFASHTCAHLQRKPETEREIEKRERVGEFR